jgi:5-methylcytosine-specific restriction protein A
LPDKPEVFRPFPSAAPSTQRPGSASAITSSNRPSAAARGYDRVWRKFRAVFIIDNPTCSTPGCFLPTVDVDHEPPLTGPDDPGRLDRRRCRPFCHSCHSRRTAKQKKASQQGSQAFQAASDAGVGGARHIRPPA